MRTVRVHATLQKDGELVLRDIPAKKGDEVDAILLLEEDTYSGKPEDRQPNSVEGEYVPFWKKLLALSRELDVELPSDLAERHDYYAHGKLRD